MIDRVDGLTDGLISWTDGLVIHTHGSACYHYKGDFERAAQDGKTCIEKDPDFVKGG